VTALAPCPRCGRPPATSALWDHPDTCPCPECAASCFDECMGGKGREIHIPAPVTAGHQCPKCGGLGAMPDGSMSMGPAGITYRPGTECATCGGKGRVHVTAGPPAAGAWIRVAEGCDMPASGTTFLVWHQDELGSDASIWSVNDPAYLTRAEFLGAGVTHWAPLTPPGAP
jgi:hypothetical protein